jgi:hypothetical protein
VSSFLQNNKLQNNKDLNGKHSSLYARLAAVKQIVAIAAIHRMDIAQHDRPHAIARVEAAGSS